jgi:hypothetical protein
MTALNKLKRAPSFNDDLNVIEKPRSVKYYFSETPIMILKVILELII